MRWFRQLFCAAVLTAEFTWLLSLNGCELRNLDPRRGPREFRYNSAGMLVRKPLIVMAPVALDSVWGIVDSLRYAPRHRLTALRLREDMSWQPFKDIPEVFNPESTDCVRILFHRDSVGAKVFDEGWTWGMKGHDETPTKCAELRK